MRLPNLLILGTAKAGTTSLYHYLQQHADVFMSPKKEPQFFACEESAFSFAGPGDAHFAATQVATTWDEYIGLFKSAGHERILAEASTWYLYAPTAAKAIARRLPEAKLVAILRHPVDRAYSSFAHLRRDGREPIADFERALAEEESRIRNGWNPIWYYRQMGFYGRQLATYYETFSSSQLRVYLYDDLKQNPQALCQDLFDWLGIDARFVPDFRERHNVSGTPRIGLLNPSRPSRLKSALRVALPESVRKKLISVVNSVNLKPFPKLDPKVRAELLRDYREDIRTTEKLLNRDLSHWIRAEERVPAPIQ